ncbi:hypothetical protein ACHAPT_009379 [Fusarium lateritium]
MTLPITAFLALCLATTIASKFTVTSNYVISKTAYQTFTRSSILTLKPTVTPTAEPVFETTSTRSHDDLEIVRRYFEPGELASTDIQTTSTPINTNIFTEYFQGVVYTAPTSCPTPFTVSVKKRINIPYEVRSQLHPTGLASTTYWYPDGWTSYTKVRAYLSDGAVPINDAETTSDWFATHYLANCQNPTATDDSSRGNVEPGNEPVLKAVAIIYGSIIAGLFSLGLVESFFWFQQMMVGEHAFRVATICWVSPGSQETRRVEMLFGLNGRDTVSARK